MEKDNTNSDHLVIIWASPNEETFKELIYPYLLNSKVKKWFERVTLVVWGPSDKTLCGSKPLQDFLEELLVAGVVVEACKACAENYGLVEKMKMLGIDVNYMGNPTTTYLKSGCSVLTF